MILTLGYFVWILGQNGLFSNFLEIIGIFIVLEAISSTLRNQHKPSRL